MSTVEVSDGLARNGATFPEQTSQTGWADIYPDRDETKRKNHILIAGDFLMLKFVLWCKFC